MDSRLVPLAIKFKIRRDMVLQISASDGSFSETTLRTTENLHWSSQPLCARINVTFFVRDPTKRLLLIDTIVKHSTCPPTSQAEINRTTEKGSPSRAQATPTSDSYTATTTVTATTTTATTTATTDDLGASDDVASYDFPLVIVVSVGVSVLVVVLIVVFAVVYVRREKRRYSTSAGKRMQLPNYRPPMALPLFDPTPEPPDEWEIRPEDLRLLDVMGEGFFGVVLRAEVSHRAETPLMTQKRLSMNLRRDPSMRRRSSTSRKIRTLVACKMLKEKGTYEDQMELLEEIKLMKRIGQHEHIVSMIACITRSHPVCLIVEYCSHGDLHSYLKKGRGYWFSEERKQSLACDNEGYVPMHRPSHPYANVSGKLNERHVKLASLDLLSFAWQIASGMEYLSGKGLVHRDLACRNVLVVDDRLLKVSDFGLTRAVHQDGIYPQKTTRRLPLRWMSIEAISDRVFTEQSDVWSFGVVMWEICTLGSFPYSAVSTKDLLSHLRAGERLARPDNCSEKLYGMMSECWCAEPERRPAFSALAEDLGKVLEEKQPTMYLQLDFSSSCELWDLKSPESGEMSPDAGGEAIVSSAVTIKEVHVPESDGSNNDDDS
ncbi:fibroblast growth factor receptor-like [Oscarella lobularis]|uniref:fibroblast growth factor receptor-like n=1 Tax=Oscarella lobularis TaxID=121494 RepID=UPI0033131EAF